MKCEKCKNNEADIYIGYLKNKRRSSLSLCESCSGKMGISTYMEATDDESVFIEEKSQYHLDYELCCSTCSTDLEHLISTGQAGCPQCYRVFKREIDLFFNKKKHMADKSNQFADGLRDRLNEYIEN